MYRGVERIGLMLFGSHFQKEIAKKKGEGFFFIKEYHCTFFLFLLFVRNFFFFLVFRLHLLPSYVQSVLGLIFYTWSLSPHDSMFALSTERARRSVLRRAADIISTGVFGMTSGREEMESSFFSSGSGAELT